jgi:hypothetical protein
MFVHFNVRLSSWVDDSISFAVVSSCTLLELNQILNHQVIHDRLGNTSSIVDNSPQSTVPIEWVQFDDGSFLLNIKVSVGGDIDMWLENFTLLLKNMGCLFDLKARQG